ncbi:MAG: uroporphyrinogen-III synthase [Agarilytica sp.]
MEKLTRLVVTRPEKQAHTLLAKAKQEEILALALPVLEIKAVEDAKQQEAIKTQILRFDEYQYALFVSQNAVQHAFTWLEDYWPQLPKGITYLAVGAKTEQAVAEQLARFGENDALASNTNSAMDSESLLQHPALQKVDGTKILIFRGCGGRTKLYRELSARGALVQQCDLYHRSLPKDAQQALVAARLQPASDLVALFSGESLANFYQLLTQACVQHWQEIDLLLPGERVVEQARSLGFSRLHWAKNASEESMWKSAQLLMQKIK